MAAEIERVVRRVQVARRRASMRPRRMAAEIGRPRASAGARPRASMRPRRMAAEITDETLMDREGEGGFNEAAANGRGNRAADAAHVVTRVASMRPRRMAAEIATATSPRSRPLPRFNEAAANGRGNLVFAAVRAARAGRASMRPRRMAAEIRIHEPDGGAGQRASMRPRRMAAEIAGPEAATCPECLRFNEAAANGRGNQPPSASRPSA